MGGTGFGLSRPWGRAGALANLVAAKLIDNNEKVFAYTFAAPATIESTNGAPHAAKYDSIFNIVNADDFIPYFPLSQWNFTRYGRTTQNVSISSSYSTIWANSWEDYQKNDVSRTYMHMSSPTAPLAEFYTVAGSRNSCYEYGPDHELLLTPPIYPSNTDGYYSIYFNVLDGWWYVLHKPMFLMKYFAAVAAGEANGLEFIGLNVASYLEDAKWSMLEQITGISGIRDINIENLLSAIDTLRLAYPHLPQSYCLLAMQISYSSFSSGGS